MLREGSSTFFKFFCDGMVPFFGILWTAVQEGERGRGGAWVGAGWCGGVGGVVAGQDSPKSVRGAGWVDGARIPRE